MRAIEIHIEIIGSDVKIHKVATESQFLQILEDFEYFKAEGLAKQVVKEIFALKDGEVFKILKYKFSKKEIINDYDRYQ